MRLSVSISANRPSCPPCKPIGWEIWTSGRWCLNNPIVFQLRTLTGERFLQFTGDEKSWGEIRAEVRRAPHLFVAQPMDDCAETLCFSQGKKTTRLQDHIVYGIRDGDRLDVFSGALTRISATETGRTESQHGGGGKDTWVLQDVSTIAAAREPYQRPKILPCKAGHKPGCRRLLLVGALP